MAHFFNLTKIVKQFCKNVKQTQYFIEFSFSKFSCMHFFEKSDKIAPESSQEEVFLGNNHLHQGWPWYIFFDSLFLKHDKPKMRNRIFDLISDI